MTPEQLQPLADQQRESLVDGLIQEQADSLGLTRTLLKLRNNQRLTGNDYRRLTASVILAIDTAHLKIQSVTELENQTPSETSTDDEK